ncbi:Glycoside hydrolase family 5 protein [Mycena indigotica]|uniref:Glycoside hydrolase family 5 protein n=1 Tax=Mycena indigotica TaxID=2126181 RepID=A0A8H6VX98_9AGAR|nr:Glycoside hydrolase family 5 protein [Mycena indigotica]KAF7297464.1 Glycoside hydrolase family 5 protein [Mycena indigotica]
MFSWMVVRRKGRGGYVIAQVRNTYRCTAIGSVLAPSMIILSTLRHPRHGQLLRRHWSSFTRTEEALTIDGLGRFPFRWLRDSCLSPECVHPSNSQKLHRSSDIPHDIQPATDGVRLADGQLHIRWKDGHQSVFPRDFLERHSSRERLKAFHNDVEEVPWVAENIAGSSSLFVDYEALQGKTGLRTAIDQLCSRGLLFVKGVPNQETSDANCELRNLAERFSQIRDTFYGPVWDVVNLRDSTNIAFTNLYLGFHQDILYFKNPPKYQALHCLRNRVIGGASLFVDAFHAAQKLRLDSPELFSVLATTPVPFHYIVDGHHLHHTHPTIELTPAGEISQINYSPPFQAPLHIDTPAVFYTALAEFARLLGEDGRMFEYTLKEGDAVIFDNRRVLHARTAFADKEGGEGKEGEPNRWLKGCYFEADTLLDRGRMLRKAL